MNATWKAGLKSARRIRFAEAVRSTAMCGSLTITTQAMGIREVIAANDGPRIRETVTEISAMKTIEDGGARRKVLERRSWLFVYKTQGGRPAKSVESSMRRWVRQNDGVAVAIGAAGRVLTMWAEAGKFRQRTVWMAPAQLRKLYGEIRP